MNFSPKSVAIILSSPFWFLQLQLCRELKTRFGCSITIYVDNAYNVKYVADTLEKEFYDHVVVRNHRALPYKETIDEAAVFSASKAWEKRLGCTYNEIIMGDRLLGRGFSLGGYNHTRAALSEKQDHVRVVDIYNQEFDFWAHEISSKNIDLFIEPTKLLFVLCREMKITACVLQPASHLNYYYWIFDEYAANYNFEKAFEKYKARDLAPIIKDYGPVNDIVFRRNYFKENGLAHIFKDITVFSLHRLVAIITGNETAKSATITSRFRRMWLRYWDGKKLLSKKYGRPLEEFKDKDFVYFPLVTEPETTLQVQSPEFFCQLWIITLLAKLLPAHMRLVTKEHIYPIGARPANFYDQILEFKNVWMSAVTVNGLDIIKRSKATVTINGSSGYEAAMLGVPTIVLAKRCDYAFLEHVFHCPLGEGLREALAAVSEGSIDLAKARIDGARFAKAIEDCSFSLGNFAPKGEARKNVDPAICATAIDHMLQNIPVRPALKVVS